jgi:hypothetical protein
MIVERVKSTLRLSVVLVGVGLLVPAGAACAAEPPIKQVEANHFGWKVNETTGEDICPVAPSVKCRPGEPSSQPGGFEYPEAVAATADGDIFVSDRGNHRVQELEANGKFVLMFGRKVNKKGGDLCTAAEAGECQAGEEGSAPGQFSDDMQSIAVDPTSGNVYVAETVSGGRRVQELTPTGQFVLEIGRKVNTKGGNLCTATEVASCTAPEPSSAVEPGAFHYEAGVKNMLAVGGPEDLIYVGDEHRVQEFDAKTGATDGQFKREISLTSISVETGMSARSIAVNPTGGQVYMVYAKQGGGAAQTIDEFDATGTQVATFQMEGFVLAIAVDPAGRLAVSETLSGTARGTLYEDVEVAGVHSLRVITRFVAYAAFDLAFNGKDEMFAAFGGATSLGPASHEVISWKPVPVAELNVTTPVCAPGPEHGTNVTLDCTLNGEVNPWGVSDTTAWFDWGRTARLGTETVKQPVCGVSCGSTLGAVNASITGVLPHEALYSQVRGEDHNVKAPEEPLTSSINKVTTETVPPRIVGEPAAAFQTANSSVFFGSVNPENTLTSYEFQYAPEAECDHTLLAEGKSLPEACKGVLHTPQAQSSQYGTVRVAMEGAGLKPATAYRYRLYAVNEKSEKAIGEKGAAQLPEGTFETGPAPVVSAVTGASSAVGTTSATISGSVNPDGQDSTYTFEVGVYNGAATRYGIVFSGPAGAGSEPVEKSVAVTGLQPGTTYAYRISIHFGTGETSGASATGQTMTFTTQGLPVALTSPTSLGMLPVPSTKFPEVVVKPLTNAQKLANALKACKKKPKRQRSSCERNVRKKYGAKPKKKK